MSTSKKANKKPKSIPYATMIIAAIMASKTKSGNAKYIDKFIRKNYGKSGNRYSTYVIKALCKGVKTKSLVYNEQRKEYKFTQKFLDTKMKKWIGKKQPGSNRNTKENQYHHHHHFLNMKRNMEYR